MENIGTRLTPGCVSWVLEAVLGERSWLNPNAAGKRESGFLLTRSTQNWLPSTEPYTTIELYGSQWKGLRDET